MVKIKVLIDGFMIGRTAYKKGEILSIAPPAANYLVKNGSCERVNASAPAKKKVSRKKATYKTRDITAESME